MINPISCKILDMVTNLVRPILHKISDERASVLGSDQCFTRYPFFKRYPVIVCKVEDRILACDLQKDECKSITWTDEK